MIISPGRSYIFVHIPKTGGTSMALALEARAKKDDMLIGDTPKARRRKRRLEGVQTAGRLWKHSTLADIEGDLVPGRVADYFVFTMVRNPWDRMVSYYHWLRAQRFDHPAVRLAARLDFSAFLAHPETAASVGRERAAGYVSIGGRDLCNAYIRLEHLDEDIAPLEDHLGFSLRPLPHENRSERERDYSSYYTDEDAGRVARLCAEDIKKFAYRF